MVDLVARANSNIHTIDINKLLKNLSRQGIIALLNSNPEYVNLIFDNILQNPDTLHWRTLWALELYIANNESRLYQCVDTLIRLLPISNDSMKRVILKLLGKITYKDDFAGELFNVCIEIWSNVDIKSGTRYLAFTHLILISKIHQELRREMIILTDSHFVEPLSPGIRTSVIKLINKTFTFH